MHPFKSPPRIDLLTASNRTGDKSMNPRFRSCWILLMGAVLASSLPAERGLCAERPSKRSDRQATRQNEAETRQRQQQVRSPAANKARSRTGRRARDAQSEELFGISWFGSLEGAQRAAADGGPRDAGKPIFCFRVLGDLTGLM